MPQFGKELRFGPAWKWNDGISGRSLEMVGGGARWRGASSGRWGSSGGLGGWPIQKRRAILEEERLREQSPLGEFKLNLKLCL